MTELAGKIAIVTGSARGTGETTARHFAESGARVIVADIRDELGRKVAAELGGSAIYQHLDVTREGDWTQAVQAATRAFGPPNVLVNNAAVLHVAAIEDTTPADFERVVAVNQKGPFLGIRAVVECMRAAGGGSIVNVASIDGLEGMNGVVAYASSKWGLRGITKVAALELGRFGIRVNAVCPAAGSFEMIQPFLGTAFDVKKVAAAHPVPLLVRQTAGAAEDRLLPIARMIAFLASDESSSCTGGDYAVDGGYTAGKIIRGAPGS